MERQPVKSNTIASLGYDTRSETLEVEFRNGTLYRYHNVPERIFDDFRCAASHGSYFQREIRDKYPYTRVG